MLVYFFTLNKDKLFIQQTLYCIIYLFFACSWVFLLILLMLMDRLGRVLTLPDFILTNVFKVILHSLLLKTISSVMKSSNIQDIVSRQLTSQIYEYKVLEISHIISVPKGEESPVQ
jgi:hypothetical protein